MENGKTSPEFFGVYSTIEMNPMDFFVLTWDHEKCQCSCVTSERGQVIVKIVEGPYTYYSDLCQIR